MRPLLVGESNPYSRDPSDALLPFPTGSAGHRLCEVILAMSPREYLRAFERRNLFGHGERWSAPEARRRAGEILRLHEGPIVLLGAKVAAAFGVEDGPFTVKPRGFGDRRPRNDEVWVGIYVLPHPSGRCRVWNEADSFDRARELVAQARGCRTCGGQPAPLKCRVCSARAVCAVSTVGDGEDDRDHSSALEFGGPMCAEHCPNHECGCRPVLPGARCPECSVGPTVPGAP